MIVLARVMAPPTLMKSFTPAPVVVVFARSKFTVPPPRRALPLILSVAGRGGVAVGKPTVTVPVLCRLPTRSLPAPLVRPAMNALPLMLVKVAPEPAETSRDAPLRRVIAGLFEK